MASYFSREVKNKTVYHKVKKVYISAFSLLTLEVKSYVKTMSETIVLTQFSHNSSFSRSCDDYFVSSSEQMAGSWFGMWIGCHENLFVSKKKKERSQFKCCLPLHLRSFDQAQWKHNGQTVPLKKCHFCVLMCFCSEYPPLFFVV